MTDFGDMLNNLKRQQQIAQSRHIEPSPSEDFLKSISDTLRQYQVSLKDIAGKHNSLATQSKDLEVGINRLRTLVNFENQLELQKLEQMHLVFVNKGRQIDGLLGKVQHLLNQVSLNNGMVNTTLHDPLADRHKKIAVQQEIGVRLQEIESALSQASGEVSRQQSRMAEIASGVNELVEYEGVKLPESKRDEIRREDGIAKIALEYGKSLPKRSSKTTKSKGLGFFAASEPSEDSDDTEISEKIDPVWAATSLLAGIAAAVVLLHVFR